jgi:hypothetical protein
MTQQGQNKNDRFEQAYDDMQGQVMTAPTGASQWATAQIGSTGFFINWLQAGQNDFFQQNIQMTHKKKLGAVLSDFHIHYVLSAAPSNGNTIKLSYAYTWINIGSAIPAIASWITTNSPKTITFTGAETANTHYVADILNNIAAPANETYSSVLLIKITRTSQGGGADTYAGNFGLLYTDGHIQQDRMGSYLYTTD